MRGLASTSIIAFILSTSVAFYDAESVKRAAIEDIIGKYYTYDPFLLPSRKGRFETYITEEQRAPTTSAASVRYEEKPIPNSYRPTKVVGHNPLKDVPYESIPATQYVVREDPFISFVAPSHQDYREKNAYHKARDTFEEGVPYLSHFRDVQPKRQRPTYAKTFRPYKQYLDVPEFKEGSVDSTPLKSEEKIYVRYSGGMVRGAVFDEPRVTDLARHVKSADEKPDAHFYPSFKGKPAKKNTRFLERETSLPIRASWHYGSDESEFYPVLSQYQGKKTRGAGRSIRFSDDLTAFTEGSLLRNGRDIASKVLWRSPLRTEDVRGPAVYAE